MGSEARARLGLVALLGATVLAFNQLFRSGDYPGPIMLGMLGAGGVTIALRRLGTRTHWIALASTGTLVFYLCLIFQAGATFYGLPTPGALRGLFRAVERASELSVVDYAPVPVRAGYVILSVTAMWVITTVGEVAAFRWRRPLVASAGPLGLVTLLLVVGTRIGAAPLVVGFLAALLSFWGLEASHRVRSWGRWVTPWRDRADEPPSVAGRLARNMGASAIVLSLAVPLVTPSTGDGLLAWRSGQGEGPGSGSGGSGRVDLLASIAPRLVQQNDAEMFRVQVSGSSQGSLGDVYWRLVSLPRFDGVTWQPIGGARFATDEAGGLTDINRPEVYRRVFQRYRITGLEGSFLPAAVQPVSVVIERELPGVSQVDVRTELETGDVLLEGGLVETLIYSVESWVTDMNYEQLRRARPGSPGPFYLEVPELSQQVEALVAEWTAGVTRPAEKLLAIQDQLRAFAYTLDVRREASTDYLTRFLTETRAGYCQQFATAFALLARYLGFPSRVSVGFLPGEPSDTAPNEFVVRGTSAHAWPEVHFQDYGWVAFEPTPRGAAAPPAYTAAPVFGTTASGGLPARPDLEPFGGGRGGADTRLQAQEREVAPEGRLGRRGGGDDTEWARTFGRVATVVVSAVVLFLLLVPALKSWIVRRRYARAPDARATAAAAFAHFEDEGAELAVPRLRSESAVAYAARLARMHRVPANEARRLAAIYEAAEYAPRDLPGEQASEARRLVRVLQAELWRRASWWARAARLFSPAPLRVRLGA